MNRIVLILPHLMSADPSESLLRSRSATLPRLAQSSRIIRLPAMEPSNLPESAFLGARPGSIDLAQGPLTVAALGYDPPERSVHFHLSLLSLDETGHIREPESVPSDELLNPVHEALMRLSGKVLTTLRGRSLDHALVWIDGSIDLWTTPKDQVIDQPYGVQLPEGDGEPMLRRLIDDSVNLLGDLDLNKRRIEEGLLPFNLLWPWGQGLRQRIPNRALQRGEPCWVASRSMRLAGLARLSGEIMGDPSLFGNGINVDFGGLLEECLGRRLSVVVADGFSLCRRHARWERAEWLLKQLSERFISPIAQLPSEFPVRLTVVAPGGACDDQPIPESASGTGLALVYDNLRKQASTIPFDERALDDPRLQDQNVWEVVQEAMVCDDGRSY